MGVLKINGKEKPFADDEMPATIAELLSILERDKFSYTPIFSGQSIELVRFVPGG